ncbi:hypothetical protein EVAR_14817_1 [Eumeta japonica]|uniref:Uncharacterized protein n=1 Tax=Eumeta variegata TaxID=151549 RepID=A0A4C1V4E1_EUMVA|nr:hypothetical protein EVAR_14817_1 [Eumeta japonica]
MRAQNETEIGMKIGTKKARIENEFESGTGRILKLKEHLAKFRSTSPLFQLNKFSHNFPPERKIVSRDPFGICGSAGERSDRKPTVSEHPSPLGCSVRRRIAARGFGPCRKHAQAVSNSARDSRRAAAGGASPRRPS